MLERISVEVDMPVPYAPVWVEGGCAFWDGTHWYTYMERNHPKIEWDVKYWAALPTGGIPRKLSEVPEYAVLREAVVKLKDRVDLIYGHVINLGVRLR